ncbi:MAG TPA: sulfotransferase [Phenylobacterium sp.]|nr:sulfotransferase [Phenylobacterium sp.]
MTFSSGPPNDPRKFSSGGTFRIPARAAPASTPPAPAPPARDAAADGRTLQAILQATQDDIPRAIVMAEAALADGFEHAVLLNLVALRLENEGRLPEALMRLHRARELAPRDVGTLNALGLCLHRLERSHEAIEVFDALLEVNPNLPFAQANRAAALQATGRLDRAEEGYRRALALAPGHPVALTGLASIASRKGAHAEAEALAVQVLKIEPNVPDASMSLARAEAATGRGEAAAARMRGLLADPRMSPLDTADAWNLLGDILDARGATAEAFDAYEACNRGLQKLYAERFAIGDSALDFARGMTGYFQRARPQDWARRPAVPANPYAPRAHVFLIGFPRSGTTLLETALAGSPDVVTLEEQEALADGVRRYLRDPRDLNALAQASEAELGEFRAAYWRRVREAGCEVAGKVFVDRYPLNTLKLPLIARLFPDARILFALRDPRDVVWSCYRRRFRMSSPMYQFLTLPGAAAFYDATLALKTRMDAVVALDQRTVRHEDLLADFEGEMKSICSYIGLEWRETMRDVAARTADRTIATPSTAQIARGLNTEGVGQWRRYADRMGPALNILRPWVERFGYPAD